MHVTYIVVISGPLKRLLYVPPGGVPKLPHFAARCVYDFPIIRTGDRGSTVVKALCYKSEFGWFDSRWCHWNFPLT